MEQPTIWVIDDDVALRLILDDSLTNAGFLVKTFGQAKLAWQTLEHLTQSPNTPSSEAMPHVILTDIRMPMMDGLSFSENMHAHFPHIPIIIMTAHADVQSAVDSYQTGAFDYLPKPFELEDMLTVLNKALRQSQLNHCSPTSATHKTDILPQPLSATFNHDVSQDNYINSSINKSTSQTKDSSQTVDKLATNNLPISAKSDYTPPSGIIGQSPAMQMVFRAIGRLSNTPITVLITGESGTGKELIAHALHEHSPRANKPFIALNMAAIPHDLIESELFGHEKGAFTGATTTRQGRFEQAHGGTLFLDEIGDMPLPTQTRLLRVLANGEFYRVGGQKPIKVDVRIIAATHQHLENLVKQGKFREDLFYRLNVIRLALPALRERREDIPLLMAFFLNDIAKKMHLPSKTISADAMQLLQGYDWQGNIRQLENVCRWLMVMASGQQVQIADLPPEILAFYQLENTSESPESLPVTSENQIFEIPDIISLANNQTVKPMVANKQNQLDNTDWLTPLSVWAKQALQTGENQILQTASLDFERCLLQAALDHTGNHKGKAAELLGWGRNTVTRKFQQLIEE